MQTPQGAAPRSRSAFAAAFLSLVFPGLGHVYAGAHARALAFAALPLLSTALLAGIALRIDRLQLLGIVIQPGILTLALVLNVALLVYRVAAVVDAWRVVRFLNEVEASGTGRLGRARLPVSPFAVAGLAAVVLVLAGGHVAVARYNVLAMGFVDCVFTENAAVDCESGDPGASPGVSSPPDGEEPPDPTDDIATPIGTPDASGPNATLQPWDGKERLNILLVGTDQRPNEATFNTDTMIVVSVDPVTRQVAMFQLPRDTVDVPVPAGPARSVWGREYSGKINGWYMQNRKRSDLWRGGDDRTRGYNALKAVLGELYGLDIRWYVEVNFTGFREVVNTLGGVNVNVQIPVSDDRFPSSNGRLVRFYVPSGPQHMTGGEALRYARSRHGSSDFDRGRRQQRVLLSLREQMDLRAIASNLDALVATLQRSIKTDIPPSQLPQLLALADRVDTRQVRSFVFTPSFYATEYASSPRGYIIVPKVDVIRRTVRDAFTSDPELEALRERLAAEEARVWVLNQSGRTGEATRIAGYLAFHGMDASAPNQRPEGRIPNTKIVVYNGAETRLGATIAYLEERFGVEVQLVTDTAVSVDIIVTAGQKTPDLDAPVVG
jgi:polyisoprenyl-teichoic acid--peptidoglycan teichoic acid transferase